MLSEETQNVKKPKLTNSKIVYFHMKCMTVPEIRKQMFRKYFLTATISLSKSSRLLRILKISFVYWSHFHQQVAVCVL